MLALSRRPFSTYPLELQAAAIAPVEGPRDHDADQQMNASRRTTQSDDAGFAARASYLPVDGHGNGSPSLRESVPRGLTVGAEFAQCRGRRDGGPERMPGPISVRSDAAGTSPSSSGQASWRRAPASRRRTSIAKATLLRRWEPTTAPRRRAPTNGTPPGSVRTSSRWPRTHAGKTFTQGADDDRRQPSGRGPGVASPLAADSVPLQNHAIARAGTRPYRRAAKPTVNGRRCCHAGRQKPRRARDLPSPMARGGPHKTPCPPSFIEPLE